MAALYGLMGFIFIPFVYFAMGRAPSAHPAGRVVPHRACHSRTRLFGFVFVAIGCLLYNFVATFTGGIEVDLAPTDVGISGRWCSQRRFVPARNHRRPDAYRTKIRKPRLTK